MISPWRSSCCESTFSKTQLQHLCQTASCTTSENDQHSNVVHYFHFFPIMPLGKSCCEIMFYQLRMHGLVFFNGLKVCIRVWFSWNLVLFVSDGCWWIAWPIDSSFHVTLSDYLFVISFHCRCFWSSARSRAHSCWRTRDSISLRRFHTTTIPKCVGRIICEDVIMDKITAYILLISLLYDQGVWKKKDHVCEEWKFTFWGQF